MDALGAARLLTTDDEDNLQAVLEILRNLGEPVSVRLSALQALQAASFGAPAFGTVRPDYIAALREVATDADPELRQRALGVLAREKDGFAQKQLLGGLRDPAKALVPPEKALQLLSYDVHSEAYPAARAILDNPPNELAKREALRLLAADATTAPVFEKILRDKGESAEIRQTAAAALRTLRPDALRTIAREALLDAGEDEQMQARSLTALTQFGDVEGVSSDRDLLQRAERLSGDDSAPVQQSAHRFLKKYGR